MLIYDAIFIPMIRTIVDEYPAYPLFLDYDFNIGNDVKYAIYDMSRFVREFLEWSETHTKTGYKSNEDFIIAHGLEKEVGWN